MAIRVAVIGAGIMGADHARILAEDLAGAELRVVCDADAARARQVAEACGAGDAATDPQGVIARADVDAVLIASPDQTHAPLTLACLEAGKPVLCEKPLAPGTADCLKVIGAEVDAGRRLIHVGFMRRFDKSYAQMRAARTGGTLGAALMMHNFHRNVEVPDFFTGAMAITNSAPHEFDIARFVLGQEIVAVSAFQPSGSGLRVAPVVMVMETGAGQLVTVEVNNNARYGYDVRAELVGETGSVFLNNAAAAVVNVDLAAREAYDADWRPRFFESYRMQSKAWLKAVETGVPSDIAASAWDGYVATAIAEAGVRALESGTKAVVVLAEKPGLYR